MRIIVSLILLALLVPGAALSGPPAPTPPDAPTLPAWDQLSDAQREVLLATVRDRWNDNPDHRAHMYERAQRWSHMTPDERNRAQRGVRRWQHMDPSQRGQARAIYERMKTMSSEERSALRDRWKTMTPAQRDAWVKQAPPVAGHDAAPVR